MFKTILLWKRDDTLTPNYIALVPAYEPDGAILPDVLKQLKAENFSVVVVNDGSGPDYDDVFTECAAYATILVHEVNRGKGAALKTGFTYIQEHFDETGVVVTLDADGQHAVSDALNLCEIAQQRPDALILGSRELKKDIPLRSFLGNTITRGVYRLSTGLKVYDTQSGLRAVSYAMLPKLLEIQGDRYEYEMNVLLEFARDRIPIQEIAIQTIYTDNNAASHFDTVRDAYRVYKEILKFSASSFLGFIIDYIMFSLLFLISANLLVSNIGARVVSATANYNLNRRFVFQSKNSVAKSATQYFLLAAVILVGNTCVLELLVNYCGLHQLLAKIVTEIIFFTLSWTVQHFVIFRREKSKV